MYKITLADGRTIDNLGMNGNNLVSETKIDESVFEDNLSSLVIEGEGKRYELHDAYLVQQVRYDDGWYFILAEISEEEKKARANAQLRADIDFISIMTGVDL